MRLGIMGGSFNPVHNGHLFLAEKAISELNLDRIVLIPAYRSPFKLEVSGMDTSADDRITMLAAAIAGDPRFTIDDCEIRREGVSYTIHTLEDIIARYLPSEKPYLVIGDDLAADFPKWRDYERILNMAEIVIGDRGRRYKRRTGEEYSFPHIKLNNEIMDVSSNMVRQLISSGGDWSAFVPPVVAKIINNKRLYGINAVSSCDGWHMPDVDPEMISVLVIEKEVRETLTTTRFLHSRNTAILAFDMCCRLDIDPMDGYIAGIAHDLAKEYDSKKLIKLAKMDGDPISDLENGKPNLLHGRAAAVLLRERFCIHNKDILEAVAVHTFCSENMSPLAKVIYIADKLEVSRIIEPNLRKMCYEAEWQSKTALDDILFAVLKKTVSKLQSRKLDLYEGTLKLLNKLNKMKERKVENS